ncbi:hypothetical protein AMTR_s00027p00235280 [Amborella trichopoda]|uniref:Secreted protein n=1 Tax=Amborella trichopoda TaxID=13333 RepID=W1PSJ5_AMBTC|nr:hypothetical protein AMTR_s00027p00235280 [Amborella trichopoda]
MSHVVIFFPSCPLWSLSVNLVWQWPDRMDRLGHEIYSRAGPWSRIMIGARLKLGTGLGPGHVPPTRPGEVKTRCNRTDADRIKFRASASAPSARSRAMGLG